MGETELCEEERGSANSNRSCGLVIALVLLFSMLAVQHTIQTQHTLGHESLEEKASFIEDTNSTSSPPSLSLPNAQKTLFQSPERFKSEFEELASWSRDFNALQSFHTARLDENSEKNRYYNVLPFDDNRVRLEWRGVAGSDYINASPIQIASAIDTPEYIACQAPLPCTFDDFWRMVWETQIKVVVMLTPCEERGQRKAHEYWPEQGEQKQFRHIVVTCLLAKEVEVFTVRCLRLSLFSPEGQLKEQRNLFHIQHNQWNDMGSTSKRSVFQLIKLINACSKRTNRSTEPIIVHCSAGIGRAGTFIAIDEALRRVQQYQLSHQDPEKLLDIFGIVRLLRSQRRGMVQTLNQYQFIYQVLHEYISLSGRGQS